MKSGWDAAARTQRIEPISKPDQRSEFEKDRDRILHSSAFHRLAGITQIVRVGEADVFHTRQQHSIKVAQVGRRLAQRCIAKNPAEAEFVGIDPEVVEASCLAHDLGHPPFGHAGERQLDDLLQTAGVTDGFEGNAQTFRILTRLAVRYQNFGGMNLTRATLAACLKYPWLRDLTNPDRSKKWGAYASDEAPYNFATEFHDQLQQTAEARLMDWADDISYSVHDLEEFHRCNVISWSEFERETGKAALRKATVDDWHSPPSNAHLRVAQALQRVWGLLGGFRLITEERYDGRREQRLALRSLSSTLISRYVMDVAPDRTAPSGISIPDEFVDEVRILKQITRYSVISSPALAAQQHGQKKIISEVFDIMQRPGKKSILPEYLPNRLRYIWDLADNNRYRFAADCIGSLTERELTLFHARMTGSQLGSVLDPIIR